MEQVVIFLLGWYASLHISSCCLVRVQYDVAVLILSLGGLIVGLTERRSFYCCYHGWQSVLLGLAFIPGTL